MADRLTFGERRDSKDFIRAWVEKQEPGRCVYATNAARLDGSEESFSLRSVSRSGRCVAACLIRL